MTIFFSIFVLEYFIMPISFLILSFIYACIWALFLKINLFVFGTSPHKRCLLLSPFSTPRMQETVLYLLCVVLKINYLEMYQFITQWCHIMFSVLIFFPIQFFIFLSAASTSLLVVGLLLRICLYCLFVLLQLAWSLSYNYE